MHPEIEKRLARWDEFFDLKSDVRRVLIVRGCQQPGEVPPAASFSMHWPENAWVQADWALRHYADQMRRLDWLADDSIPHVSLLSGTEIIAECFGCPVTRPQTNMPYARYAVHNAQEAANLKKPNLMDTPLRLQFEKADYIKKHEPDALIRMPDLQSPLDIAAMVWDKNDFYCAVSEEPEAVHDLCEKCFGLLCDFLDEWFSRYGTDYVAHFPDYPMHGGLTISEDEIGIISNDLFEEFALPYLNRLSERYGGIGVHSCANSRHQWPLIKKIKGLKLLNLIQPGPVIEESIPYFETVTAQMPEFSYRNLNRSEFERAHVVAVYGAGQITREQMSDEIARLRSGFPGW
ncbi:MAG: hypothetical protein IJE08_12850 [Clostridia bacterium]|nr:hypothetical protein [Clostridia bacterium]